MYGIMFLGGLAVGVVVMLGVIALIGGWWMSRGGEE